MTDIQNTEKDVVVPYEMVRERQEKNRFPPLRDFVRARPLYVGERLSL